VTAETVLVDAVLRVVRDALSPTHPRPIGRETRLAEDLGATGADLAYLADALREELGVEVGRGEAGRWRTVGEAIDSCLAALG